MKKIFAKIFSMVIVLCMCVLGTGCFGVGDGLDYFSDLWNRFQSGEISEDEYYQELAKSQESSQLYGTKVLYRPESYDYSGNSGGTQEQENDYYGQYAWNILYMLEGIYGIANETDDLLNGYYTFNTNTLPYLYDSIRYQVDEQATVTSQIEFDDKTSTWSAKSDLSQYIALSANLDNAWNWSFDYDVGEDIDLAYHDDLSLGLMSTGDHSANGNYYFIQSNIVQGFYSMTENVSEEENPSAEEQEEIAQDLNNALQLAYGNSNFTGNYLETYIGTGNPVGYSEYSDFVKVLEYVIYCYSLDLTPGQVIVEPVMTTTEEGTTQYYTVRVIETSNGQQIELSADQALEQIKEVFEKLGSYVGVAERNKDKISKWILDNVIGSAAMQNDIVSVYSGATQITYNGTTFVATSADQANQILAGLGYTGADLTTDHVPTAMMTETEVGREYGDTIVNLVDKVCDRVTIGSDDDGQIDVDDRYLASEVMEYMGNSFSAGGGDDPFPYFEDFSSPQAAMAVRPLEYQSAVLMFKEEVKISMVSVVLQYDADLDGYQTQSGDAFDSSRYLTIEIGLNYFNHQTRQRISVATQTVNVPDGKLVNPLGDENLDRASAEAGIEFSQTVVFGFYDSILPNNQDLIVGAFKTDIGGGILKTDVGRNDYRGNPIVSNDPIIISGLSAVKDYYEIIEPTEEQIAQGQTYLTGQLNAEKFMGDDGCDYLEITYRVIKRVGDTSTNYKFYTGLTATTA